MSKNSELSLGDIMDEFYSPVVNESIKKGGNTFTDKNALPVEKDNAVKGGYKKTLNDLADSVIDNEEDEEEDCDECDEKDEDEEKDEDGKKKWTPPWEKDDDKDEDEEQIQESTKIMKKTLNKGMAKKSIFDTLYAKCLNENFGQGFEDEGDDLGALGLDDASTDDEMGDDFGGDDEGDSITFTLDRATAEKLMDVIGAAMGQEHDESEGEDEYGGDDEGMDFEEDDDGMDFDEDEEVQGTKVAPDKKGAFQGKSNKVGGRVTPKGSHSAKTDVTDEVGTKDGAPPITALQGKSNQVPGSTLKAKADYFK